MLCCALHCRLCARAHVHIGYCCTIDRAHTWVAPARTKAPSNGSLSSGRMKDSSSNPNTFT